MKRNSVRLLAMVVALSMLVLSLVGCGTTASPAQTTAVSATTAPTTAVSASAAPTAAPTPATLDNSPITLNVAGMISPIGNQYGILTDPIASIIKQQLGINIYAIDAGDSTDWITRFNALIASNDLPDIFLVQDPTKQMPMLLKAGQILALDNLINPTNTPNMAVDPKAKAAMDWSRVTMSTDGKLYTLGVCRGTWDNGIAPTCGNFFRIDLWAKLGYPAINSYDDLLNVLKKMQDLEPETKDGKKTYAIGTWFGDSMGWGDWLITCPRGWATGNLYLENDRTLTVDISTNQPSSTCLLTDSNSMFWQTIDFYYKAMQMGIMDPDSFTQKWDAYNQKLIAGEYMYYGEGWDTTGINQQFIKDGMPEKGMGMIPAIGTDKMIVYGDNVGGERQMGISSKTKYPERAIHLLDWVESYDNSTVLKNGIEGVYWTKVDGMGVPKPSLYDGSVDGTVMKQQAGVGIYGHFIGYCDGTINPVTKQPIYLGFTTEAMNASMNQANAALLTHFGTASLADGYKQGLKTYSSPQQTGFLGSLPDDLETYDTNLQNYEFQNMFNIMLAKNDDDYAAKKAKFISDLDQFKVQDIYKYWFDVATKQAQQMIPIYKEYYGN